MARPFIRADRLALIVAAAAHTLRAALPLAVGVAIIFFGLEEAATAEPAVTATAPAGTARDQTPPQRPTREYLIKAAILFNLTKFATWPASAFSSDQAPVRVCILGRNPFGRAAASLDGKKVGRRPLELTAIGDIATVNMCHVLFISDSERDRIGAVLDSIARAPVLTVADFDTFSTAGGMVELARSEDRSRLEINVDAARRAGLKISSKLLRLADTVDTQSARLDSRDDLQKAAQ